MQFTPFKKEHLPQAATLLVRQARYFLQQFPLLPDRISDPAAALSFLTSLVEKEESRGAVATDNGKLVAYLLGSYSDSIFFGRHVWVPFGGLALEDQENTELIRRVYAAAGQLWIDDRVLNHYLVCPAIPGWLQAGFSLTFGQEQAYAITSVNELRPELPVPQGIVLREVVPSDADQLFANGHWIAAHLNTAPVWEPVPQQHLDNILPEYAKLADDPTSTTWVAVDGDQIVAYVVIYTADSGPEHYLGVETAAHFAAAATHPQYRNRGIGRALYTHILNVAQQQGYHTMFTDWRTTNLPAATHWPSYGFEPFAYRLLRRVNPIYEPYRMK